MLRVAEYYSGSDTGRQRRANEDSMLARSPLFVVADGMGGAQAGEVASRMAIESFEPGVPGSEPERELAGLTREANARIHDLSHANAEHAGMGTTLTALYVGEDDVAIAHVGDSRAYLLRDGELMKLTDDHSLVDELLRQGRLTPEEAIDHPQRSVITRALGPEATVDVDTRSLRGDAGDVLLVCSDGLTTMISEEQIASVLRAAANLHEAGEALIAAANEAGGRDNITVLLVRLETVGDGVQEEVATASMPALAPPIVHEREPAPVVEERAVPRVPRAAQPPAQAHRPPRRWRRLLPAGVVLGVLALLGAGAYVALQYVYFIGTNNRGLVTMYQGLPLQLPGGLALYSSRYVSGVSAATIPSFRRHTLLDHSLHSESRAASLIRSLELGQLE
jgi:PPM family protein phosphatase